MAGPIESEAVYDDDGNVIVGDCSNIITQTQTFTYTGPLHNEIPRPLSAADRSGDSIWTEDFSPSWFNAFMFGNGVVFDYTRQDGSPVHEDFTGKSVKNYYLRHVRRRLRHRRRRRRLGAGAALDLVLRRRRMPWRALRWRQRTVASSPAPATTAQLVRDALDAVNASNTSRALTGHNYDLDGDGVIDRLWIVHAGYGEEDGTILLNRTDYGEAAIWSHSSRRHAAYPVAPGHRGRPLHHDARERRHRRLRP